MSEPGLVTPREPARAARLLIVLAGLIVGQAIVYGPSLVGRKVLLPLDILAMPTVYLPATPEAATAVPWNFRLGDLVFQFEPLRRFGAAEVAAGRLPKWIPWQFAGAPFFEPAFSPFLLLEYCTASPVMLAWAQMFAALVAGFGCYLFSRRVLRVSFWPAAVIAWCYPLTAFFIFWQGYTTTLSVVWLPWILLAADRTVRGKGAWAPVGLSAATCLVLISGRLDVAGQVLLTSAVYGLWCWLDAWRKEWRAPPAWRAMLRLAAGCGLGLLLAAPAVLPIWEYSQTGVRMARRTAGNENRPPVGLSALPLTVLPDLDGADRAGSLRLDPLAQMETSAAAYTGVLATLLVAPLAFCSRRHRSVNLLMAGLIFLSLGWCLNVPGLVSLLRLPVLNLLSHNRWVFATSFAILALAAVGLETILRGEVQWRQWFLVPTGLLTALALWCAFRTLVLPEPFATGLANAVAAGKHTGWVGDMDDVKWAQAWLTAYYDQAALVCAVGLAGWLMFRWRPAWQGLLFPSLAVLVIGELVWFAASRTVQSEPALYYPPVPVLQQVAKAEPGRVIGCDCLPANLASMCGLRDIRGYDSVDPARLMDLLAIARNPKSMTVEYAFSQYLIPNLRYDAKGEVTFPPVLDMLGVRYAIFRGAPPPEVHPRFQGNDYWVGVNPAALPRGWVARSVLTVADGAARLGKLAAPSFNPRDVAYVETPLSLPDSCRGTAQIVEEIPTRLLVSAQMETPGLLVLADLWDPGWRAYVNGQPAEILRTDHALRGVALLAGNWTVEFRYEPASSILGLKLAGLAAVALAAWLAGRALLARRQPAV